MVLRRTLEPGNGPVPVHDFRKKANLHLLAARKILRVGRPRMGNVFIDIVR
jgi:hypothetical protein